MFIQPQKDNGLTCQTRFQVKSRKECSRTNSIVYFSWIANRLGINEASSRSSDLVKWSFNGLVITHDSIKGPVINSKEQRKGVLSILELTSLDYTNSQECPVRHLSTYLRASKGRRKPHSGDSVFIQNEGKPLDVKEIKIIVLSTLSSSVIDISMFKSHSTRSGDSLAFPLNQKASLGSNNIALKSFLFP
ncbi:hypothetical protein ACTFIW_000039 [Dictyostelium discoideum]